MEVGRQAATEWRFAEVLQSYTLWLESAIASGEPNHRRVADERAEELKLMFGAALAKAELAVRYAP